MPKFARDQPFWTSVILHLVVLLGLFLATIVEAFRPKEPPHVFEMVSAPTESRAARAAESPPVEPLDIPDVKPMEPLPEPPKPQPGETPRPAPPKPEPRQIVNYKDFLKDNPIEEPGVNRPAPRKRVDRPVIDTPEIVIPSSPGNAPSESRPISRSDLNELAEYQARLRARLDAVWNKPANLGASQIHATAIFHVSAGGRITRVRLSPSSGNASFDQSVTAAFQRVGSAGPTPTGEAYTFKLTFRMTD